jgi:hypothetical protein
MSRFAPLITSRACVRVSASSRPKTQWPRNRRRFAGLRDGRRAALRLGEAEGRSQMAPQAIGIAKNEIRNGPPSACGRSEGELIRQTPDRTDNRCVPIYARRRPRLIREERS